MRVGDTFTYTTGGLRRTEVIRIVYAVEHERTDDGATRDLDVYGVDAGVAVRTRIRRDDRTVPGSVTWRRFPTPAAARAWLCDVARSDEVAELPRARAIRALEGAPPPVGPGSVLRAIRDDPELWAARLAMRRIRRRPSGGQGRWMEEYDGALRRLVDRFCPDRVLEQDPMSGRLVVRWREVARAGVGTI